MSFDGREYPVPVLKIASSRKWKESLAKAMGDVKVVLPDDSTEYDPATAAKVANAASDHMLDLLAEYDETGFLAGEKGHGAAVAWLETHASEADLWVAFLEVLKATFPFVADPKKFVLEMLSEALRDAQLDRVKSILQQGAALASTSGSSTNGAPSKASRHLKAVTPTNSSPS
jgi:hypothetical protein